jgi:hypothetical protein
MFFNEINWHVRFISSDIHTFQVQYGVLACLMTIQVLWDLNAVSIGSHHRFEAPKCLRLQCQAVGPSCTA